MHIADQHRILCDESILRDLRKLSFPFFQYHLHHLFTEHYSMRLRRKQQFIRKPRSSPGGGRHDTA